MVPVVNQPFDGNGVVTVQLEAKNFGFLKVSADKQEA
jgi:hypothetical protein